MKIIDLLNDIENDEIEDGTIFEVIGDFFYKLIIIDKNLYCINEMTKKLEILDSKYIGRFDNRQYEIIELSNKIEEEPRDIEVCGSLFTKSEYDNLFCCEEEKKIPEKLPSICACSDFNGNEEKLAKNINILKNKYNEIIDYLKSKGE